MVIYSARRLEFRSRMLTDEGITLQYSMINGDLPMSKVTKKWSFRSGDG